MPFLEKVNLFVMADVLLMAMLLMPQVSALVLINFIMPFLEKVNILVWHAPDAQTLSCSPVWYGTGTSIKSGGI
jgi:hypothetical protein